MDHIELLKGALYSAPECPEALRALYDAYQERLGSDPRCVAKAEHLTLTALAQARESSEVRRAERMLSEAFPGREWLLADIRRGAGLPPDAPVTVRLVTGCAWPTGAAADLWVAAGWLIRGHEYLLRRDRRYAEAVKNAHV